jgi:hypothetical protein
MKDWLKARFVEPSTHAAVAGVIAALVPLIPPPWGLVAAAVFGALGFSLSEKK